MKKYKSVNRNPEIEIPKRSDIWYANLEPTKGDEIQSRKGPRPVLILSSNALHDLRLKLVIPLTGWKSHFKDKLYHVKIKPDKQNNLKKTSSISALHLRSISTDRFGTYLGRISVDLMEQVLDAVGFVVEMEFEE